MKIKDFIRLTNLQSTHGDYDHAGEAINLINKFKVNNVLFNSGNDNELELKIKKLLDDKNINYINMSVGNLVIGNYRLDFINEKNIKNENEDSLVIDTNINNKHILFMADAGFEVEKVLIDEYNFDKVDILKVGHHGSKYSSNKDFIDLIKPSISLISAGVNNRFGHPDDLTIETLKNSNSNIYTTSDYGMIKLILKDDIQIKTCLH